MKKNIVLAVAMMFAMFATTSFAQFSMPSLDNTITVISSGEVTVKPDACVIEFNIEETGDSLEALTAQVDASVSAAKTALAAAAPGDLKITVSNKKYSQAGNELQKMFGAAGGNLPEGYTVKSSIALSFSIKGMETAKIMKSLDAILATGKDANLTLGKFGFGLIDDATFKEQAMKKAIENSARDAKTIAQAGGKEIINAESFMQFDMSEMMGSMFSGMGGQMKTVMDAIFAGGALSDTPDSVTVSATIFANYKTK